MGMRTASDEARTPKYAHIERERRWLIEPRLRPDVSRCPYVLVQDRYITGTRLRLRRMTQSANGVVAMKLTKKYEADDPLARPIMTAYLTNEEYRLFEALPAVTLAKRLYDVADGAFEYSVDIFEGSLEGLELAEIEWPDDQGLRALAGPFWAVRDVSEDARYWGAQLARCGIPEG
jgi:CYTH domain-containing protein